MNNKWNILELDNVKSVLEEPKQKSINKDHEEAGRQNHKRQSKNLQNRLNNKIDDSHEEAGHRKKLHSSSIDNIYGQQIGDEVERTGIENQTNEERSKHNEE